MTALWVWLPAIVSWLAAGVSCGCALVARRHRREIEALLRQASRPPTQINVHGDLNAAQRRARLHAIRGENR